MRRCGTCGHLLSDSTRYCTQCGAYVGDSFGLEDNKDHDDNLTDSTAADDGASRQEGQEECVSDDPADTDDAATIVDAGDKDGAEKPEDRLTQNIVSNEEVGKGSGIQQAKCADREELHQGENDKSISRDRDTTHDEHVYRRPGDDAHGRRRSTRISRGRVASVLFVAAVSVLLVLGAVRLFGRNLASQRSAYYGSSDEERVLRDTRIIPCDDDGAPLTEYEVSVSSARDMNGAVRNVADYPVLQVADDNGFTPDDLLDGYPDGVYVFSIASKGSTRETPSCVVSLGESGETLSINVGDESPEPEPEKRGPNRLYLEKIEELEEEHGKARYGNITTDEGYITFVKGVVYAGLIDFGDSSERLVVAYSSDNDTSGIPTYSDYCIEVWEWNEGADELVCVLGGDEPVHASGSDMWRSVQIGFDSYRDEQTILWTYEYREADGYRFSYKYIGLNGNGAFGVLHDTANQYVQEGDAGRTVYYLDGAESPEEDYQAALDEIYRHDSLYSSKGYNVVYQLTENQELLDGTTSSNSYLGPSETGVTVDEVKADLQHRLDNVLHLRGAGA